MRELELVEERIAILEEAVELIKERNKKVEIDKAWETSRCRILSITTITYIIASLLFLALGVQDFYLGALIPTVGYFLSTQSLPLIKSSWIQMRGIN